MNKQDLIRLREGLPEDRNLVLSTMLLGLYYGSTQFSHMPKDLFMREYHKVVEGLLDSEDNALIVACLKDENSAILGYSLVNKDLDTVHFTFVKKSWRNIGIMNSLIPASTLFVTHLTKVGLSLIKKRPHLVFNPFLINPISKGE